MEGPELNKVVHIVLSDRYAQSFFTIILIAILFASLIFGFLSGITLLFAYICGCLASHYLLKYKNEIGNVFSLLTKGFHAKQEDSKVPDKCTICGDKNCNREKIVHKQQPWAGLLVPEEVDEAVENLLNKTMEEFITVWYKYLSVDDSFPSELRQKIRYATSVVLSRGLKVNLGVFLCKKVIPTAVKHLEMCMATAKGKLPVFHPALYSRKAELNYLRCRVKEVLPLLLERPQLECSMFYILATEVIAGWLLLPVASAADVTILNNLLLILTENQPLTQYPTTTKNKVEFLKKFVEETNGMEINTPSALHPDMSTILKDQSLLYAFMQFLKDQAAVHILQFCLDVEEFKRQMSSPELTGDELDLLYRDAWDLYSVYFSPHSPDNIGFDPDLVLQMRKVLSKDVTKLKTSRHLYQAYDHAYNLLDKNFCPLFHSSDEFYTWLCGPRTPCGINKSGSSSPSLPGSPAKGRVFRNDSGSTVSKLSNKLHKIKGALRSQTVLDGHAFDTDAVPLEADTEFAEDLTLIEDEEGERDLSAWKVRIIRVENKVDSSSGKLVPFYTISVQRITPSQGESGQWTVERRLGDFYSLEAKLTEFHGDFPDTQLPPCGLLAPSPPTDISVYEAYLQKLLSNPTLRGSDLLHWFLSSPMEFVVEDNGFGKLFRKSVVPLSLRKERGQNIEPFITTYISSTDLRTKTKLEWKDDSWDLMPRNIRCLTNTSFGDNLGLNLADFFPPVETKNKLTLTKLTGPAESILYCCLKIIKLPNPLVKVMFAFYKLFHERIDSFFCSFIGDRIQKLLVPQRVAHLIQLLQRVVYEKQPKSNPKEVAKATKERMQTLHGLTGMIYKNIYMALQQPIMNKQLLYTLLDLVLEELFPEACCVKKPSS